VHTEACSSTISQVYNLHVTFWQLSKMQLFSWIFTISSDVVYIGQCWSTTWQQKHLFVEYGVINLSRPSSGEWIYYIRETAKVPYCSLLLHIPAEHLKHYNAKEHTCISYGYTPISLNDVWQSLVWSLSQRSYVRVSNRKVAVSNPQAEKVQICHSAPEKGSKPTVPL
jgi:hypothetical protein